MKPRPILALVFGAASVGAFLFLPARGEWVAFGFAVLAAFLADFEAAMGALKGLATLRMPRAVHRDDGDE